MKIGIVGAGSMQFTHQVVSDLLAHPATRHADYHLIDIDPDRLHQASRLVEGLQQAGGAHSAVHVFDGHRAVGALSGLDYCINEIQVGGLAATQLDFDVPARYGIRQTIADTRGIGGISRALRTIPVVVDLARALMDAAPGAVLLNYTNPMAMVMDAVHREVPDLEAYGLCHSTEETARTLAGYLDVPYEELDWMCAGINHMAWFLTLSRDGADLYPRLRARAADPAVFRRDPVRFELLEAFGLFVTESSEHSAEYFPYFLPHDEEVDRLSVPVGEYLTRSRAHLSRYRDLRADLAAGRAPALRPPSGEYAPRFIQAHSTRQPLWFYANVPNRTSRRGGGRLIENLPAQALVEVPCGVVGRTVRPVAVGSLPGPVAALTRRAVDVEQLVVDGALSGQRDTIYQAAMLDPLVSALLPLDAIRRLVDELVEAHGALIPPLRRRAPVRGEGTP